MSLTFHEPTHAYYWLGKRVPNVTGILELASKYGYVRADLLEIAQDRGTYVHKMCELDDKGDLHPDEEQGPYAGYLKAWRSFLFDYGADWEAVEERGYSRMYGFAGTLDRRGLLKRRYGTRRWVLDIKTSLRMDRAWGLQTAAYRQICAETVAGWATADRGTVQLREDGRYLFKPWQGPLDLPAFLALKTLTDWNAL